MHINYQRCESRAMVWNKDHLYSTSCRFVSKSDSFRCIKKSLQRKFRAETKTQVLKVLQDFDDDCFPRIRKEIWWDM